MFALPLFISLSNLFIFNTRFIHAITKVFTEPLILIFHIGIEEFIGDYSALTDAFQNRRDSLTFILLMVKLQTL